MHAIELFRPLEIVVVCLMIVLVIRVARTLCREPHLSLKRCFDKHGLGRLEGSIKDLQEVIVVAHRLEPPENTLRRAVETNLARGVKYTFLVSASTAEQELNGYIVEFQAIATRVVAKNQVRILRLTIDWTDYPYVFYRTKPNERDIYSTIAVRGSQKTEGIADLYFALPSRMGQIWAKAIMSDAPTDIPADSGKIDTDQFDDAEPQVLRFSNAKSTSVAG